MALRSQRMPKSSSSVPTTCCRMVTRTDPSATPKTATSKASKTSAATVPSSADRHPRTTPTARTTVSASTASTEDARNALAMVDQACMDAIIGVAPRERFPLGPLRAIRRGCRSRSACAIMVSRAHSSLAHAAACGTRGQATGVALAERSDLPGAAGQQGQSTPRLAFASATAWARPEANRSAVPARCHRPPPTKSVSTNDNPNRRPAGKPVPAQNASVAPIARFRRLRAPPSAAGGADSAHQVACLRGRGRERRPHRLVTERETLEAHHFNVGHADETEHRAQIRFLEIEHQHRPAEHKLRRGRGPERASCPRASPRGPCAE